MIYLQFIAGIAGLAVISALFVAFGLSKRLVAAAATLTAIIGVAGEFGIRASAAEASYYNPWYAIAVISGCYAAALSIAHGFQQSLATGREGAALASQSKAIILGFWIIAPPVWFAIDYFLVFNHQWPQAVDTVHAVGAHAADAAHVAEMFDRFKYGQEVASKTWLALVTLLTGLYFGKDFSLTATKDRQ